MIELPTEPRTASRRGSPFAAELDTRLAGDEPLANVVAWWRAAYWEWSEPQPYADEGGPSIADLTENEDAVYCLGLAWALVSESEVLTEDDADADVQNFWTGVRQARDALRAAQAGNPD
jgi:hypothetical protein